jgi:pimeloyl-ACP methyl ester carboxylesterase
MMTRVFIHGLDSSSQGTKARFFRKRYPDMIIPDFEGDLQERMKRLEQVLRGEEDLRLVGSSFGGLMAPLFAMDHPSLVTRLVLLAPALNMLAFVPDRKVRPVSVPVRLYHGTADTVIPLEEVVPVARRLFTDLRLQEVEDDHMLHKTFRDIPWDELLS